MEKSEEARAPLNPIIEAPPPPYPENQQGLQNPGVYPQLPTSELPYGAPPPGKQKRLV